MNYDRSALCSPPHVVTALQSKTVSSFSTTFLWQAWLTGCSVKTLVEDKLDANYTMSESGSLELVGGPGSVEKQEVSKALPSQPLPPPRLSNTCTLSTFT